MSVADVKSCRLIIGRSRDTENDLDLSKGPSFVHLVPDLFEMIPAKTLLGIFTVLYCSCNSLLQID